MTLRHTVASRAVMSLLRSLLLLSCLGASAALLNGCGQTGGLYQPAPEVPAAGD